MRKQCVLAIDQGTTNTKALLVDRSGTPVFRTSFQISLTTTPEGFTEQDPELIWNSVVAVTDRAVQYAQDQSCVIEAIAISNQRETALAWSAVDGKAPVPAMSWQCGRGTAICARLSGYADEFGARTGLPLAPLPSVTKWAWLLENNAVIQSLGARGDLRLGTVDSWLIHKLTGAEEHISDLTNASRTGLLNLATSQWDSDLLELFGIPLASLPQVRRSSQPLGVCRTIPSLAGVPILSAIGDSHAAMFGHGCYATGTVKATYGTGSSLMALTPALGQATGALARTVAWWIGESPQYAVEGNIPMTGSAVQWLGEFLGLSDPTPDLVVLAERVRDSGGVFFVPAMVGLGAPYWDANARGAVFGLGRHHTLAHLGRAALDSIAYQAADVFFAMESTTGVRFSELRADGGATRNAALMQFQADVLGRPVSRSNNEELSAIGAAWLSGLALGWWTNLNALEALACERDRFEPRLDADTRDKLYGAWQQAIARVRSAVAVHP
jgi:glycerol kinase